MAFAIADEGPTKERGGVKKAAARLAKFCFF
jgi:hypothetical protein